MRLALEKQAEVLRSPPCPTQRRRFPLGRAVLAVVHASHYPLQRRSRGVSTDVQGRLQEDLQENSGITHAVGAAVPQLVGRAFDGRIHLSH